MDLPANDDSFLNNFNNNSIDNIYNNGFYHQPPFKLEDNNKSDKIQITKRVKSIRQLKNNEKESVRLCFKQFSIKNLVSNLKDMQIYIASKTKIWIEKSGLEYLKKSEEQESRDWYLRLAKDQFAYVYAYRESMDKIGQLEKELWEIFEDPKTTQMGKVKTIRELHKLVITETLLLRDLPFVTNLSKCYDISKLDDTTTYKSSSNDKT